MPPTARLVFTFATAWFYLVRLSRRDGCRLVFDSMRLAVAICNRVSDGAPVIVAFRELRRAAVLEPLDDIVEHRRQEDTEQRHAQHTSEDGDTQCPPHFGPGALGHHERHHAENERE